MLPLLAFGIIGVLGMTSLAVDVGYYRYQQRLEQSAADSAAVAGAIKLYYPVTAGSPAPPEVIAAARKAASDVDASFVHDGSTVKVTVNSPPTLNTPPNTPNATPYPAKSAVEVVIEKQQPQFFGGIFGVTSPTVASRAVAVMQPQNDACLYQLGLSPNAVYTTGHAGTVLHNCAVDANGDVSSNISNSTTGVNYYGSASVGSYAGPVRKLSSPVTDPCFKIPGCAFIQSQIKTIAGKNLVDLNGLTAYNAPAPPDFAVVKNLNTNITLGPGIYYVEGGVNAVISADGVTIVNVNSVDDPRAPVSSATVLSGLGNGHPFYTPPTTGPTAGIAFYQGPENTDSIRLNGGGNGCTVYAGVFYAPTLTLRTNGGQICFQFAVLYSITAHGHGIDVDPDLGNYHLFNNAILPTRVVLSQ